MCNGKTQNLKGVELRGQVASLNSPTWFAAMAGEFYIPSMQYIVMSIKDLKSIYMTSDEHYHATWPNWWKNLDSWLEFKIWAQKQADVSKCSGKEDKSGDQSQDHDIDSEEDESEEDQGSEEGEGKHRSR
ncbi:hypothetical protein FRC06_001727 [Ceratobasidium sp. 370]|nr:hypothetical protein FRC06_001727 [Ceratobasidium sp. 370]